MKGRKAFSLSLGFAVSSVFLWVIFRAIPMQEFLNALGSADTRWVLAALVFFLLGYVCRIWRWRLMLALYNAELTWGRCAIPFMTSIAANNVLPFRAGDLLRGVAFSRWLGLPTSRILATMLVERLLDVLSLIVALAVALTLLRHEGVSFTVLFGCGASSFLLIAGATALILLFPRICEPPIRWLIRNLVVAAPKLTKKIDEQVNQVFHTLSALAERARMLRLMLWSCLVWGFEACVFYAIAKALPDMIAPVASWLAMPVGTLSTMLPSTPGYIGTFHYFVMQSTVAVGNPEITAAAFAFLVHLALYIPATLWGGGSFVYWMLSRKLDQPA